MRRSGKFNTNDELILELEKSPIIPVVSLPKKGVVVDLAKALLKGGICWLEITFRNKFCSEALEELYNSDLDIRYGAGTVRTIDQVKIAYEFGADFIVSPGFNKNIIEYALDLGVPFIPGVDSTYTIEKAQKMGLSLLKMFPASVIGGPEWCKSMQGPYYNIRFIPTGGIDFTNFKLYLDLPNVVAVGGSFIAPKALILKENYRKITDLARKAIDIMDATKKE